MAASLPAWSLKLGAACITLAALAGSLDYASAHVKNVAAPLQPPVAGRATTASPAPSVAPSIGPLITVRPGQRTAPTSAAPRLTLEPGVRSASLAPLTFTHVS